MDGGNVLLKDKESGCSQPSEDVLHKVNCNFSPFEIDNVKDVLELDKSISFIQQNDNDVCNTNNVNFIVNNDSEASSSMKIESSLNKLKNEEELKSADDVHVVGPENNGAMGDISSDCIPDKSNIIPIKNNVSTSANNNMVIDFIEKSKFLTEEKEEELSISPEMINVLRMKLLNIKEQKEMFDSLNFNIQLPMDNIEVSNTTVDKHMKKSSSDQNNANLNSINVKIMNELKQVKQQLAIKCRQLDRATELMRMMKKGLADRGDYIKLLLADNKRLREEVKLAMEERKTLLEKFSEDVDLFNWSEPVQFE